MTDTTQKLQDLINVCGRWSLKNEMSSLYNFFDAPKEEVIRRLAKNLNLNPEELIFLAGRIPQQYEEILRQNPREMLVLFQRMQENPEFAQEISQATREKLN